MKAKLFFLALLLSSATPSLQAGPMSGEGEEKAKENEAAKAELQQNQQQHDRDVTAPVTPLSSDPATPVPATASAKKEPSKLTPEQILQRAHGWLAIASQTNDPNAKEWGYASARINMVKKWSQNTVAPRAPSFMDRFVNWLTLELTNVPTPEEQNQASLMQPKALALEAALPAWKKSAIAQQAVKEFSSRSSLETPREEATDCWAFWRKAPAAPDSADEVFNKVRENEQAWKEAAINFHKHIDQLTGTLKDDVLHLWMGTRTSDEVNNPLAQAWVDELKRLEQAEKESSIKVEMDKMPREIALKIFATNLISAEAQKNVEVAMAAYEAEKDEDHFNSVNEAIYKLEAVSEQIKKLIATEDLPLNDQEKWTANLKRLAYITAVYKANLAASSFWAAYDDEVINGFSAREDDTLIRDRDAKPTPSPGLDGKRWAATTAFYIARDAKKALLSQESQLKISGLELEGQETLTPEEQAAAARIAEFQERIAEINGAMSDGLPSKNNQSRASGTETDDTF